MTQPGTDWDRLARHMAGELSPAEAEELRRWLAENEKETAAIAALDAATRNMPPSYSMDVEVALRKVKGRLAPKATPWRQYAIWATAATIVIAVASLATKATLEHAEVDGKQFATAVGKRDSIRLDDGSLVILGPASRIDVHGRKVDLLTGEAFFVVTHSETDVFTVRAGGTVIRDMGTEFSVHTDRDSEVRVVVSEGSVQFTRDKDGVVLVKGDVGTLAPGGRIMGSRGAATPDDLAWTQGRLVFRDAPVSEVAADLRRWYGVELKVTDTTLLKRHFTGSFSNEPPARVVEAIALALGARADRRGDTVHIRPAPTSR